MNRGPLIAGALALLTALGTTLPWARAFIFNMDGIDSDRGIVTLIAALAAAGVCAWRAFFGLDVKWYFAVGLPLGLLMFVMPTWFLIDVRNTPAVDLFGEEVSVLTSSFALYLTVGAAFAYMTSFLLEASFMFERRHEPLLDKRQITRID